jgi:hypothetical protein
LTLDFFLIEELVSLNFIETPLYFSLGSLLQLHPHSIPTKLHSNCLLKANSRVHNEGHFLCELGKNPYVHVVASHHVHYFNAPGHIRGENSQALPLLEQIIENVGLANKVIFVLIEETEHEPQNF